MGESIIWCGRSFFQIILLATITMIAAPAFAADPALPAPVLSPPSLPAPNSTWTGLYAGTHFGAAWNDRDATIFRQSTDTPLVSGSTSSSGVIGGAQAGFNYAYTPSWIAGVEADVSATNLHGTSASSSAYGERDNRVDVFGTARARLGYAWNGVLAYATGGFAWADEEIVRTQQFGSINNARPGTRESATATGVGWTAGAGAEWCFQTHWTARIEYLHLGLDSQSFIFPLSGQRIDATARIEVVRFGLNYSFN